MWKEILCVGIGGGIGSILRFITSRLFVSAGWAFTGTFAANIAGCFLIGLFSGWMSDNQPLRLLFIVGFCGGYTTFSTFALENLRLIEANQWGLYLLYTFASVALGLLAVWGGVKLAN
jgi:CrcB protein